MWRQISIVRQAKLNLVRFIRLRGTPDEIAKGTALGIFIGMTPTFGLQMLIAIFFAWILKENRLAAALGVWVTNPVTAPFIYAMEYESGRYILGISRVAFPDELTYATLTAMGWNVIVPLAVGSLIYAVVCGLLAYSVTLRIIPSVKAWRIPRWPRPLK